MKSFGYVALAEAHVGVVDAVGIDIMRFITNNGFPFVCVVQCTFCTFYFTTYLFVCVCVARG